MLRPQPGAVPEFVCTGTCVCMRRCSRHCRAHRNSWSAAMVCITATKCRREHCRRLLGADPASPTEELRLYQFCSDTTSRPSGPSVHRLCRMLYYIRMQWKRKQGISTYIWGASYWAIGLMFCCCASITHRQLQAHNMQGLLYSTCVLCPNVSFPTVLRQCYGGVIRWSSHRQLHAMQAWR